MSVTSVTMTLYGTQGSGSAAVEAALVWAGAPFREVDAASWKPGPGLEELKAVNPLAQIPTLVLADGTVLSESAAILIHLGLALPDSGLLPNDPSLRAQAIRGLVFIAANCYAAISVIDFPERWYSDADEAAKERIRKGTRERLHLHWSLFADQFELDAEQPGALGLLATVVSKWSGSRPHLQAARPAFYATLLRIEQHPRVAAVFARHWPQSK